jgi:hypothetical protein
LTTNRPREELRQALWPEDTFVDFELGVNQAVKKLRQALQDSAEHSKFIETRPKYEYRLAFPVQWVTTDNDKILPPSVVQPIGPTFHHANWLKIGAELLLGSACIAALSLIYVRRQPGAEQTVLASIPFTAYAGREVCPTFSADGSQIAFAWDGDPESRSKGFDLYVKSAQREFVALDALPIGIRLSSLVSRRDADCLPPHLWC